jgi:hypothetical protein
MHGIFKMPIIKVELFAFVSAHLSHTVDEFIRETRFNLSIAALSSVAGC